MRRQAAGRYALGVIQPQQPFLSRQDLLREQASYAARLDQLLERVHAWSYRTTDAQGWTLEDLIAEIRMEAHSVRAIDKMICELE